MLSFIHTVSNTGNSLILVGIEPVSRFEPMSIVSRFGELVTQELGTGPVNWLAYKIMLVKLAGKVVGNGPERLFVSNHKRLRFDSSLILVGIEPVNPFPERIR